MRTLFLYILITITLSSCLKDEPFKKEYPGNIPQQIANDWEVSSPETEQMDPHFLEKAFSLVYDDERFLMARSLLVFRNGKLVAEAYPHDPSDINKINNIQSCTKSFSSIVTGIAVHNRQIGSLDEKVYDIFPEDFDSDISKRSITIREALCMQTGLRFDNSSHTLELYQEKSNSVKYVLSQDRLYPSGTVVNYNDGAPHLISKVVEKKTGKSLAEYANEKLFVPLNIKDWKWEAAKDGTTYGAFSLYLKPRDLGKIGQLLLNGGKWKGERIIDSTFLEEAISTKVALNFNNEPYGYYFWILPAYKGYAAVGHGGQFLLVVPDKKLVVVYTAWPYTSHEFFDQKSELINIIVNSCK